MVFPEYRRSISSGSEDQVSAHGERRAQTGRAAEAVLSLGKGWLDVGPPRRRRQFGYLPRIDCEPLTMNYLPLWWPRRKGMLAFLQVRRGTISRPAQWGFASILCGRFDRNRGAQCALISTFTVSRVELVCQRRLSKGSIHKAAKGRPTRFSSSRRGRSSLLITMP